MCTQEAIGRNKYHDIYSAPSIETSSFEYLRRDSREHGSIKYIDYSICYCITTTFFSYGTLIFFLKHWRSLTGIVEGHKNTKRA